MNFTKSLPVIIAFVLFAGISNKTQAQSSGYDLNHIVITPGTANPVEGIVPLGGDGLTKDKTLDVVNWNVDWLGAPEKTENKHGTRLQHISNVAQKLYELDADLYALQEVVVSESPGNALTDLVADMNRWAGEEKYKGIWSDFHSFYWQDENPDYPPQCLAFIWNTNVVTIKNDSALLQDIASSSDFGYGRLPFLLDANVTINEKTQRYMFINIHLKAYEEYSASRASSMQLLRSLLNVNFYANNVMLIGDYNVAQHAGATGEISNWGMYDDNEKDGLADYVHACGGKSPAGFNNIEHILVSNELFDELAYIPEDQRNLMISGTRADGYSSHYAFMTRLYVHEETGNTDPGNYPIYDPAKGLTMLKSDYQIIVDYVKNHPELSKLDESAYNDSEYYFGASAYYSNFDIRSGKYHSTFNSWEDAVQTGITTALLPVVYSDATAAADVIYTVYFETYSGEAGSGNFDFICVKSAPDPEFELYQGNTGITSSYLPEFTLSPNPTRETFTITFYPNQLSAKYIHIYNLNGTRIYSKYVIENHAEKKYLIKCKAAPGLYIIEAVNKTGCIRKKLIIR